MFWKGHRTSFWYKIQKKKGTLKISVSPFKWEWDKHTGITMWKGPDSWWHTSLVFFPSDSSFVLYLQVLLKLIRSVLWSFAMFQDDAEIVNLRYVPETRKSICLRCTLLRRSAALLCRPIRSKPVNKTQTADTHPRVVQHVDSGR